MKIKPHGGFSLVELMVVAVIIAVLTAIAVPVYDSVQQVARDRADEANVKTLNSATLQWVLADDANDPENETTDSLKTKLADYIMEWPVSPNGKTYELDNGLWQAQ